ncbi:MAG: hypothetical protein U1E36_08840 [Rickettsiales bacterium]
MLPVVAAYSAPVMPMVSSPAVAMLSGASPVDLPLASVTTAIASQPTYNNNKGASVVRDTAMEAMSAPSVSSGFSSLLSVSEAAPSLRFSSPFLAQLMAQASPASAASIAQFYANDNSGASTLDSRLMEIYSMVKYKPSFASQPMPAASGTAALMPNMADVPERNPAPAPEVYSNPVISVFQRATQSRAEAVQTANYAAVGVAPKAISANDNRETSAPANDASPKRRFASLVKQAGVSAYQASAVRIEAHLTSQKPESTDNL